MQAHDKRIIHSSKEAGWRTPRPLFDKLDHHFHFGVDCAATVENRLCSTYFGPDHKMVSQRDALKVCWSDAPKTNDKPVFWINPPYSRELLRATGDPSWDIAAWAKKCAESARFGEITVVGLFPYSPQTEWWYSYVRHGAYKAHEIWEIPHRVTYLNPDGTPAAGNSGGNSCVLVWRPDPGFVGDWQPAMRVWDYRD